MIEHHLKIIEFLLCFMLSGVCFIIFHLEMKSDGEYNSLLTLILGLLPIIYAIFFIK